jgi:di/tricarboxylate transporter
VVAAAASFLTPVATPANPMMMEPAGYRFADYWKLGLPLLTLFVGVAVFPVPVIWGF